MTELKTLKDIREQQGDSHGMVNTWYLKAEAIKWVKYIRQLGLDEMIWCEFFNLTEEDLQ